MDVYVDVEPPLKGLQIHDGESFGKDVDFDVTSYENFHLLVC